MIAQKQRLWISSHSIAIILWSLTVLCAILSRIPGLQALVAGCAIGGVLFIFTLSWWLAHLPQPANLPATDLLPARQIGRMSAPFLLIGGIVALVFLGMVIGPGTASLLLSALVGTIVSIAWRRELGARALWLGLLLSAIVAAGIVWLGNGDLTWAVLNLVCLPPIFTAGVLLARRTGLAQVRVLDKDYGPALAGFLTGCVLAVPAALFNLLGNLQSGDSWVLNWWQPLYAIVPALAEETWARLFLLTLIYALVRSASPGHPVRAISLAIAGSALVHSFAHTGINPVGLVIGSLLYGVPSGLLLIKKDFEHVAGYHFLIDLVRWVAAWVA